MARKKKRTKAERSAAAKASWARRRAAAARGERLKVLEDTGRAMAAAGKKIFKGAEARKASATPDKSMAMSVLEATGKVAYTPVDGPLVDRRAYPDEHYVPIGHDFGRAPTAFPERDQLDRYTIAQMQGNSITPGIVKEGDALFLTQSFRDGSHSRQRISEDGARKLFKELGAILL